MGTFVRFAGWALDGLAWAWPVTATILLGLAGAALHARQRIQTTVGWRSARHLATLAVPAAILALGTWCACENCTPSSLGPARRDLWATWVVDGLLGVQLIAAGWLVWKAHPVRLVSAMFQLLLLWYSFWASFIAAMSISGDWL
jgi:hypothetical protein